MLKIYFFFFLLLQTGLIWSSKVELEALMPNVSPKTPDLYLCHQVKLDESKPVYITEFEAKSTSAIAHHILLYACSEPAPVDTWNCGEMSTKTEVKQFPKGPVCRGKQTVIYAWALDAPKLVLPDDVAFKLGGDTGNSYLVVQVHYAHTDMFMDGTTDDSGIILKGQTEPVSKLAGVYLFGTNGFMESGQKETFDVACEVSEDMTIHPFAYRTHAHKLGILNSGYLVRNGPHGTQTWTEIGRRSPQLPQMFYPVSNEMTIKKGDILAAQCIMYNSRDHLVKIGSTGDDEMCNFYMMFWVDGDQLPRENICYSNGPPYYHYSDFMSSTGRRLKAHAMPVDMDKVPAAQVEELKRMEKNGGMHGMHGGHHAGHGGMHMDNMSMDKKDMGAAHHHHDHEPSRDKLIGKVVKEYENELSERLMSGDSDELEANLNELEKAYLVKKLLARLNLE